MRDDNQNQCTGMLSHNLVPASVIYHGLRSPDALGSVAPEHWLRSVSMHTITRATLEMRPSIRGEQDATFTCRTEQG
jgi:hypothetical protein